LNELKRIITQFKVIDMYRELELRCKRHQSGRHMSMFTMFRPSDDCVLLTMFPAELR